MAVILGELCGREVLRVLRPRLTVCPGAAGTAPRQGVGSTMVVLPVVFRESAAAVFLPSNVDDELPTEWAEGKKRTSGRLRSEAAGDLRAAAGVGEVEVGRVTVTSANKEARHQEL